MKVLKLFFIVMSCLILLGGCVSLKPVVSISDSFAGYKYVYVNPTSSVTSCSGLYSDENNSPIVVSTINPSSVIAGILMKKAFVQLPELREDLKSETLIVNYGESGKRRSAVDSTSQQVEVTIQMLSADDLHIVYLVSAGGRAHTESDAIREAINRCMETLFSK